MIFVPVDVEQDGMQSHFTVLRKDREPLRLTINQPGLHNILNALGCDWYCHR